mmetsp:Transcript_31022/g.93173  ORF Transcript_31022/g.93173 Transcript_31022/m.93173 type:complete len:131 (+) Transcript_31022:2-394(+)
MPRYGNAHKDWARTGSAQAGIAPVVVAHDMGSLNSTRSVTRESFAEGSSTKTRPMTSHASKQIEEMFQPEYAPFVSDWLKHTSPWAAETLLDTLHEIAAHAKAAGAAGPVHPVAQEKPPSSVKLPDVPLQ